MVAYSHHRLHRHLPQSRPQRLAQGLVVHLRDHPSVPRRLHLPDREGRKVQERQVQDAAQQKLSFDAAVREAAGASGGDVTSQLTQLPDLKAQGVLTDAEFDSQKAKILVAS